MFPECLCFLFVWHKNPLSCARIQHQSPGTGLGQPVCSRLHDPPQQHSNDFVAPGKMSDDCDHMVTDQNSHNSQELEPFSAYFGLPRLISLCIYPQLSSYMIASTWQMALTWNTSCRVQTQIAVFPWFCHYLLFNRHSVSIVPSLALTSQQLHRTSIFCLRLAPAPHAQSVYNFSHFMSKVVKSRTSKKKRKKSSGQRKVRSSDFQTSKQLFVFSVPLLDLPKHHRGEFEGVSVLPKPLSAL